MTREQRAHELADAIRRIEHCDVFSNTSVEAIERTLSDHAIACLSDLRQSVVNEKLDAAAKQRVLSMLADALREESR